MAGLLVSAVILGYYLPQARRGRCLAEGEGVSFYLPMRELVADAWNRGRPPVWNPYVCGGMPLLADCQAGTFYPPNLLFWRLDPLVAMNAIMLAGHVIAAWGMVLLLRAYRVSAWAAGAGALAFVFSGFMIAHMGHVTIVNAAAWLPWLCLATHRWCTTGRRGWLIGGTLLWATQIMAGHPQIVFYSAMIVGMQVIALVARQECGGVRRLAGVPVMIGLAAVVCGVQLWPTISFSRLTGRTFEASLALFQNYRFSIQYTPLLWLPYLFGTQAATPLNWPFWGDWNFVEQAGYVGLLPWMLLPAAACLPGGRARFGRAWAIIGGLSLLLAWNTDTPVGRLLFHVPMYNSFESAGRHLMGLVLALSICAGVGLDALAETTRLRARRWARRGSWAVIVIVLTIVAGGIWGYEYATVHFHHHLGLTSYRPGHASRPWMEAPWAFVAPCVMVVLSAWALWRFADPRRRARRLFLLTVLLLDVLSAGYLCAWRWRHDGTYRMTPPPTELARLLAPSRPGEPPPRYLLFGPWGDEFGINAQGNMLYRLASLNGYGPFQLRTFKSMLGGMHHDGIVRDESLLSPGRVLDAWSCRYVIVRQRPGDHIPSALADHVRYRRVAAVGDLQVYENLRAAPRAWFVQEVVNRLNDTLLNDETVLEAIRSGGFDPLRTALVSASDGRSALEAGPPPASAPPPGSQTVRWLAYEYDRFRLEVLSSREAVLVLAEPFLEGWNAYLDDDREPVPIARVDYMLRAVRMPAGRHTIEMRYEPPALRQGAMLSSAGIAALVLVAVWPRRVATRPAAG